MCAVLQTADRDSQRGASGNPNMELKELSYSNCNRTTILLRPYDKSAPAPCPNDSEGSIDHNNARNTSSSSDGNSSMCLHDLSITRCGDVYMCLLQPFEYTAIFGCQSCTIVIGAVAGLLHVVDCDRVNITSAAHCILVRNCHNVKNFCFTPSSPLLVREGQDRCFSFDENAPKKGSRCSRPCRLCCKAAPSSSHSNPRNGAPCASIR